jgi:signal transduction histidine kinase/ActR/RegA family two-component response regulator
MRIVLPTLFERTRQIFARLSGRRLPDGSGIDDVGLRDLIDRMPAAVGIYSLNGGILYLNEMAHGLLREGVASVDGVPIWDAFAFKDPDLARLRLSECLKRAIVDGTSRSDIWVLRPKTAGATEAERIVCLDATVRPFQRDVDGRVRNVIAFCPDVTERKRLERTLAKERQIGTELTQLAPVAVLVRDEDDRVMFMNRLLEDIVGLPLEAVVGRPCRETIARCPTAEKPDEDHGPAALPTTFASGDGSIRIIDWQERSLPDGTLRLSVGTEATLQRAMQASLEESQARLIEAQKLARVGSWVWDVDAGTIACSPEASQLLGRQPVDMTVGYDDLMGLVHPDDRAGLVAALQSALSGDGEVDVEHRMVRPDGTVVFARARAKVEFDLACRALRMIGTTQDVTDQHLREAEVREREARLRFAAASAKMAVYVQDPELRYTWIVNCPLDKNEREILGRTDLDLSGEAAAPLIAAKTRVLETGEPAAFDWEPTIEGQSYVFRIYVEPLRDSGGRVTGLLGASQDVTAIRMALQQLREAQKMEAIGRLTGGIAHDFNNILGVVLGNLELVQRQVQLDAASAEAIRRATSAVDHGAKLTRRLLAFARQQSLEPTLVDIVAVVQGILPLLGRAAGETCSFSFDSDVGRLPVLIDAAQLEAALINLAVNARDAMPEGGDIAVSVTEVGSASGSMPAGRYARISMRDTGIGMTADVRARAFEPFFTTKSEERGSGLGLSTVLGFVRQSGGDVSIMSAPGSGTEISILLPVYEAPLEDNSPPERAVRPPPEVHAQYGPVVVVDDNADLAATLSESLAMLGIPALVSNTAVEGLALIRSAQADVLVTDVVLPGRISGLQLAEAARAERPDLRIILMSGFADATATANAAARFGASYLQKPVRIADLIATIHASSGTARPH